MYRSNTAFRPARRVRPLLHHPRRVHRRSTHPPALLPLPHPLHSKIFALGDIANTGASKTVRSATTQIQTVKDNILSLINGGEKLEEFKKGPSGIHLSLGLYESVKFGNPEREGERPRNGGVERDLKRDMGIEGVWGRWGVPKGRLGICNSPTRTCDHDVWMIGLCLYFEKA